MLETLLLKLSYAGSTIVTDRRFSVSVYFVTQRFTG